MHSKVWVCDHLLAGIADLNPIGAWMSYLQWPKPSFRGVLLGVYVSLSVIRCNNPLNLKSVGIKGQKCERKKEK